MIWLLGRLFTREQLMKAQWTASSFWKYLGFVPLLLAFYQGSMGYVDLLQQVQDLSGVHLYMLVSRGILVIIGGILVISVRSGSPGTIHVPRERAQHEDAGAAP